LPRSWCEPAYILVYSQLRKQPLRGTHEKPQAPPRLELCAPQRRVLGRLRIPRTVTRRSRRGRSSFAAIAVDWACWKEAAPADLLLADGSPLENVSLIADPDRKFMVLLKDGKIHKDIADTHQ